VLQDVLVKVGGAMELVVSGSGTLVYKSVMSGTSRRAVVVTRSGGATPMGVDSLYVAHPSVSPDGRRVAMTVLDGTGGGDIWIKDRLNGSFSRLTTDGTSERAVWTPDGRQIAFWNRAAATGAIRVQPWDGSRVSEILTDDPPNVTNVSFGPPGSFIAARQNSPPNADILLAPVDSPQALRPLLATPANEMLPRVSPTGRLLAYVTDETGRREVYVRRLPGPAGQIQVSVSGGDEPVWAPNGRELFFRSSTHLMAALITEDPELEVLRRDTLFRDTYVLDIFSGGYDVFPSGTEFVFLENLRSQNTAFLGIANWPAHLQQRMRAR
jgi:Tol biopolymer transport system component